MEENQSEEGITLGELWHIIIKRGWLVLVIMIACIVISSVGIGVFVNGSKAEYSLSYLLEFPGSTAGRYPDGTAFRYQAAIDLDNLLAVKELDSQFAQIDVIKMNEQNDISITSETETGSDGVKVATGEYTITAKASYFSSDLVATAFLKAVASTPMNYVNNLISDLSYSFNLENYTATNKYSVRLSSLSDQRNYLLAGYTSLIATYGENYRYMGKTLTAYLTEVNLCYTSSDEATLVGSYQKNGFVLDKELYRGAAGQARLDALEQQVQEKKRALDDLQTSNGVQSSEVFGEWYVSLYSEYESLKTDYEHLKQAVEYVKGLDDEGATSSKAEEDFVATLEGYYNTLSNLTATYTNVNGFILETESDLRFNSNRVEKSGVTNIIIAAFAGAIGGLILACVVVCIIDLPHYRRSKLAAGQEVGSGKDAQAEKPEKPDEKEKKQS